MTILIDGSPSNAQPGERLIDVIGRAGDDLPRGDALIGTITAAVDTPESIRAIRNLLLLTKFFANIPPDVLNSLAETVGAGAQREKAHKAPGLLHLLWRLRNENSRHAAAVALDLLEGLGKGL